MTECVGELGESLKAVSLSDGDSSLGIVRGKRKSSGETLFLTVAGS